MLERVRRFGLEYCDLPTMLGNVTFMLRVLALNIDSRFKGKIPITSYIFNVVTACCYFYVYLVSMVWFVFWRCRQTGDVLAALIVFALGIASEIGPTKLFFMFFYKDAIRKIVDGYLACDATISRCSRLSRNILKNLRQVKKRALIFWMVIIGNGVIYILKPIVTPGRHTMEDLFVVLGLEPSLETPNYEITFILCSGGVWFTCYLPANITAFLIVLVGYTEATMLGLSEELLHLWSDAQTYYRNRIEGNNDETADLENVIINKYINKRLQEIIVIHTTNLHLIRQINYTFRIAIAVEFMFVIAGLIAELLGGLENTYIAVPYALIQVAMDCLTGQRMINASANFERAVYECKWENFNVVNMKTVMLMLQSAQNTMILSAGGVSALSFSCLMTVIRSIYSAYTTLRSTMT